MCRRWTRSENETADQPSRVREKWMDPRGRGTNTITKMLCQPQRLKKTPAGKVRGSEKTKRKIHHQFATHSTTKTSLCLSPELHGAVSVTAQQDGRHERNREHQSFLVGAVGGTACCGAVGLALVILLPPRCEGGLRDSRQLAVGRRDTVGWSAPAVHQRHPQKRKVAADVVGETVRTARSHSRSVVREFADAPATSSTMSLSGVYGPHRSTPFHMSPTSPTSRQKKFLW